MKFLQSLWELVTSPFRTTPKPTDAMPRPPLSGGRPPVPSTDTDEEIDDGKTEQDDEAGPGDDPPWLKEARKEDGTREGTGSRNNPKILQYFTEAGHPEIIDDETAWCAAFAGAMLKRGGKQPSGSLMAKSYLNWGKPLDKPRMGAIMVFNRAGDPRLGHVGFYVGEDHDSYFILGGNQWDSNTKRSEIVNVGKQPKSRLVGIRWPSTPGNSRTVKGAVTSGAGVVLQQTASVIDTMVLANEVKSAGAQLQALQSFSHWVGVIGTTMMVIGIFWVLYARFDDMKNKGR